MKILILVVIYKINLIQSKTIKSLIDSKDYLSESDLFIWDNSPTSQDISALRRFFGKHTNIFYEHHPENLPLSKVYNKVINQF